MSITVEMLGKAQVKKNTNFVTFPYRKAEGLFYYLIARQTITRDEAIGIFGRTVLKKQAERTCEMLCTT